MKALVKYGNKPREVEIRDVPEPVIGPDDVLLEVKAAGICGWDIEMWMHTMANPVTVPVIQGHEFCGVIRETGANVSDFSVGDRVVSETSAVICGRCPQCIRGVYHLCGNRKGFGYGVDGAFTDLVKVPRRCLHRIPEGVDFTHAALTEPACVAYQALSVLSDITPGAPVVIVGPGPVGLFSVQMARICGAGPIIVVGTNRSGQRFAVAKEIGATHTINHQQDDARAAIMDLTGGQGAPLVVDAAGNSKALKLAVDVVARQGQITKLGWGPEPVDFSLDPLLSKAARLQGSFSHNWSTWENVISLIASGASMMEPMISHCIKLDQWLETFEAIHNGQAIKGVIEFNID